MRDVFSCTMWHLVIREFWIFIDQKLHVFTEHTHTHTDDVMFIGVCLRFFPTFIFKSFLLYKINNFLNNISQTSLGPLSIKWRHSTSSRAVHFCPLHATTRCVIIYNSTETRKNDTKMIISLYWLELATYWSVKFHHLWFQFLNSSSRFGYI